MKEGAPNDAHVSPLAPSHFYMKDSYGCVHQQRTPKVDGFLYSQDLFWMWGVPTKHGKLTPQMPTDPCDSTSATLRIIFIDSDAKILRAVGLSHWKLRNGGRNCPGGLQICRSWRGGYAGATAVCGCDLPPG